MAVEGRMSDPNLSKALARLEARYTEELDRFTRAENDGELPLWMRPEKVFAAKAMIQARRDVVRDLRLELGGKLLGDGREV